MNMSKAGRAASKTGPVAPKSGPVAPKSGHVASKTGRAVAYVAAAFLLLVPAHTFAQFAGPKTGIADNNGDQLGTSKPFPVNCVTGCSGGGGGSVVTNAGTFAVQNTAATPAGTNAIGSVLSTTGPLTLVTLDIKTVTTGGTAVNALSAGHRTKGGWIKNPETSTNTVNLCINEIGAATGTTSSGDTTCIAPGATYQVAPAAGAVSVISSDSSHPFSGMGYN